MPKHWIADLEVTEYPRKGRPSSFCFLDVRAPGGCISKSLLKGECLETRVRSELAALDHLAQGGERLYARPLLALATLPNPNPQRSVPPSQGCLHLSRTSLTTSRSSARSIQARRLLPRDIFQSKGGRAAMRILEVPYRVIKQAATMRGKLEDRGKGWKLLKTSLDGCAAQFAGKNNYHQDAVCALGLLSSL